MPLAAVPGRARRFGVCWPVRMRRLDESTWHPAKSLNISTSGILIDTRRAYNVGDRLELEISFLGHPDRRTIIGTFGHVVRRRAVPNDGTAVQFDVNSGIIL
jgi:Tfp pilus assembly protein PilZ